MPPMNTPAKDSLQITVDAVTCALARLPDVSFVHLDHESDHALALRRLWTARMENTLPAGIPGLPPGVADQTQQAGLGAPGDALRRHLPEALRSPQRFNACLHEAGHAVVAVAQGLAVHHVMADSDVGAIAIDAPLTEALRPVAAAGLVTEILAYGPNVVWQESLGDLLLYADLTGGPIRLLSARTRYWLIERFPGLRSRLIAPFIQMPGSDIDEAEMTCRAIHRDDISRIVALYPAALHLAILMFTRQDHTDRPITQAEIASIVARHAPSQDGAAWTAALRRVGGTPIRVDTVLPDA